MILSHKYRFIFLKNGKTAGTSVEIALSKFCGPDDIIAPIAKPDEKLRRSLGYPGKQNYEAPFSEYSLRDYWRLYRRRKARYYDHMGAAEIKEHVGDEIWNSYYKFCVVRNPWDRLISRYFWATQKESPAPSIDEFIERRLVTSKSSDPYILDGKIAVDKICRFESLSRHLEEVRQHVGIPEPLELPRTKHKVRKDKRHYREILNEAQKNRIAELCRRDIEWFGYEF